MRISTAYQASFQTKNGTHLLQPGIARIGLLSLVVLLLLSGRVVQAQCINPPASVTGCDVFTRPIRVAMDTVSISTPDAEGRVFDSYRTYRLEGLYVHRTNTVSNTNTGAPNGTSSQTLYQNLLYKNYLDWHFAVPNGPYTIVIHFNEAYGSAPGRRVFDVFLEGTKVEPNFDIYVAAGNRSNYAITKQYTTTVTDNDLEVQFKPIVDNPLVAGIEIIPGFCTATQSVSINRVSPSGCYQNNANQSKSTVSVEVAWNNALPVDSIKVVMGAQTRWIHPGQYNTAGATGTIRSPQVVAFEVDANGSSGAITAAFANNPACTPAMANYILPMACPVTVCNSGNLGGTVFNDYNVNGTKDAGETFGTPGVTVNAIDCNGNVFTTTSDVNGVWSLTANITYPVRVEFSNLPAFVGTGGTVNGTDNRTTVQFVNAASCNVNLGVLNQTDYCQTTPDIFIPCYVNGDPLPGGSAAGTMDAFIRLPYGTSGLTPTMESVASASQVGTLWGVAYDKIRDKVYTSAILRRHSGLGPLGLGGIYATDAATNTVSNFVDVQATLGIDVGSKNAGDPFFGQTNSARGLNSNPTQPSHDSLAFSLVGKVGIGDIEVSENSNFLYFMNLFDKKLYKLDLTGASPTVSASYIIPSTCTNGAARPFGLKVKNGKVYVGVVCDGTISQSPSDTRAYVYALDESTGTFSTVFDFPLTYSKGFPLTSISIGEWNAWTDDFTKLQTEAFSSAGSSYQVIYPQPLLSDIEIDLDGSLILGFADRTGLQTGWINYGPTTADTKTYLGYSGGDILRAAYKNGTYILENNAYVGGLTGSSPNNDQGPGFGEFYNDDFTNNGSLSHSEIAFGALALKPGSGQTLFTAMDPVNNYAGSGGFRYVSNTTGTSPSGPSAGAVIYTSGQTSTTVTFGKSVGLGDMELNCGQVSYLEIGNRVWFDTDKDGIQDACENPLLGVKVALYQGSTLIAYTTTDANGEYYFSDKTKTSTTWPTSVSSLSANTAYTVRFGTDGTTNQFTSGVLSLSGASYNLTTAFSTAPQANTINDSNAQLVSGVASASVTTGALGSVNHTIDAGFVCAPTTVGSLSITPATCTGSTANSNGRIDLTGIQNGEKAYLYTTTAPSYTATGSQPVSASAVSFTGLANPSTSAGQSYSIIVYNGPNCFTVVSATLPQTNCTPCGVSLTVTPGLCVPATNAYVLSGTITATNVPTSGTLTITSGAFSPRSLTLPAGNASGTFSYSGLVSTGQTYTLTASYSNSACSPVSQTYTAPVSCSVAPVCSISATASAGVCNPATNAYSATVVTTLTNAIEGTITISIPGTAPISQSITSGTLSLTIVIPGLISDGASHTATVSLPGCSTTTATYTAPGSCTQPAGTKLTINKLVNKSRGIVGEVLTYTVMLTNVGNTAAANVVVRDSMSTGLHYLTGSATAPAATTFTPGTPSSSWTIGSIAAGQSLSLTFQASADSAGILYNKATIPGDTASVCTSIPVRVCAGDTYTFTLTAPAGRTSYRWYRTFQGTTTELTSFTTNTLEVTQPGAYSLAINNLSGQCPDFSCCPFILQEDSLPSVRAIAITGSCVGNTPQANGQIVLSGFRAGYSYQYALGISFNPAASLSGAAQGIPLGGVIASTLASPVGVQAYTVRVYNGSGCYSDVPVSLQPTVCSCPAQVCLPYVVQQTKRPRRIGDAK